MVVTETPITLHPGDVLRTRYDEKLTWIYEVVGPGEDSTNIVLVNVTDPRNPTMALQQLSHVQSSIRGGFTTVNGWRIG